MSWPEVAQPAAIKVLVVCTANICRSPVAAQMLRNRAGGRGLHLSVASAGFLEDGRPADPTMVALARTQGIEVGDHRSQVVDRALVQQADVIVTMERRHARELVVLAPEAGHRIHTLLGLVAAGSDVAPDGSIDHWLRTIGATRAAADLMGDRGPDIVPDPYGRAKRHYRACLATLDTATAELVDLLGPPTSSVPPFDAPS